MTPPARAHARFAALLACTAVALASPAFARADGDPASDVLLGQDVFLPYSPISAGVERRLYAEADAARRAGFPVKIALIGSRSDLGVVPVLFAKPEQYARFLSEELSGVVRTPVLVVMPSGFGVAVVGRARSVSELAGLRIAPGADGLGSAAIDATARLAAAAGHPLPANATVPPAGAGASPATTRHALTAMLVLALLAGAAIGAALVARSRRSA
jgi:hypothetical protein